MTVAASTPSSRAGSRGRRQDGLDEFILRLQAASSIPAAGDLQSAPFELQERRTGFLTGDSCACIELAHQHVGKPQALALRPAAADNCWSNMSW